MADGNITVKLTGPEAFIAKLEALAAGDERFTIERIMEAPVDPLDALLAEFTAKVAAVKAGQAPAADVKVAEAATASALTLPKGCPADIKPPVKDAIIVLASTGRSVWANDPNHRGLRYLATAHKEAPEDGVVLAALGYDTVAKPEGSPDYAKGPMIIKPWAWRANVVVDGMGKGYLLATPARIARLYAAIQAGKVKVG